MLDLQTYMLLIGIGNLCFAGLMRAYARGAAAQPALGTWMWARVTLGLSQVASWSNLQLGSDILAQLISIGWIAGMALELSSYCLFFRYRQWRRLLVSATGVAMVLVVGVQWYGVARDELVSIIALTVALFAGAMGATLLWPRGGTPVLQRIIGGNDAILALALLLWIWSGTGTDPARTADVDSRLIESFSFFAGYVLMIVKGFGFLLLCKQEDDRKMLHLATVDSLTGVLNRYAFFDQAQALRGRPAGTAHMVLLMLDLDHFKRINDRFGHASGDQALCLFGATMQATLAKHGIPGIPGTLGILGRLGGEEFALALPFPLEQALVLAEGLRVAVTEARLPACAESCRMTVSIGVALLNAGETVAAGLARADQALYDAKHGGRDRVVCFSAARASAGFEVEPAQLRQAGIGMAGQNDAVRAAVHPRQQFFA